MDPVPPPATDSERPAVMFVSRRYPPSVGGMQTLARSIHLALEEHSDVTLVALGRSQKHLPWFLPYASGRVHHAARSGGVDRLVFGDALVYATISPLLPRSAPPCVVMVHGRDLTFESRPYRAVVEAALRRADRVVANSHSTAAIVTRAGVDPSRCVVLNPGVELSEPWPGTREQAADRLRQRYGLPDNSRLLLNVGRLVRRKGVAWFVSEVMPQLPATTVLLVAGSGPEEASIGKAIEACGLEARVRPLGYVDDETRALLFAGSDIFVMPNVPVAGDVEGFGLVAVEAANAGLLVAAARLEGIVDAIADGSTGYLCEPLDADAWAARLTGLLGDLDGTRLATERFTAESRRRSSFERMARDLPAAFGLIDAGEPSDLVSGAAPEEQQPS